MLCMYLLSVLYVCILRGCDGDGNTGVWARGGVVAVDAGCDYIGCIRCSGFVYTTDDVLEMSMGERCRWSV